MACSTAWTEERIYVVQNERHTESLGMKARGGGWQVAVGRKDFLCQTQKFYFFLKLKKNH